MDESDDDQPDGKTAALSSAAMERLNTSGKPWMIAAGFHRPHDPFLVPKKYFELYTSDSLQLHRDAPDATPLRPLSIGGGATQEAFNQFTDQDRLEFLRAYYAGVSFMDAQVGRLMETLDRLKLWDRTVVIFMGDHGYHLGERNWWNKSTLFERSCRTPLIVAAPGGTAGVCRGLVEMVDLYPTVTDYCALTTPDQFAGKSLRTLLRNPEAQARDAAFTLVVRGKNFGQTVRTDRWRFIQWSDRAVELYDHTNDPEEMHDQSTNPAHADEIEKLRELIKARVGGF